VRATSEPIAATLRPIDLRFVSTLVAPPLCAACARPCSTRETICTACAQRLAHARPGVTTIAGVERVIWAAPYEGVARELVAGLKFGGRLQVATVIAGAIVRALPNPSGAEAVVAVPPAPARRRRRGFDAAELIAGEVAGELGLPVLGGLRRANGPRQVGRRRADRLASPPRVEPIGAAPACVLLVDDVLTTGATLAACAPALERGGAGEVTAAVFARSLGAKARAA
jgi:ComF family protein